jgi:hypothetical protein
MIPCCCYCNRIEQGLTDKTKEGDAMKGRRGVAYAQQLDFLPAPAPPLSFSSTTWDASTVAVVVPTLHQVARRGSGRVEKSQQGDRQSNRQSNQSDRQSNRQSNRQSDRWRRQGTKATHAYNGHKHAAVSARNTYEEAMRDRARIVNAVSTFSDVFALVCKNGIDSSEARPCKDNSTGSGSAP